MGEVQEQRYICKICKKACVSGKSLGGHMRIHLALISASRKAASAKAEIKMDFEGDVDNQDSSCTYDCKGKASFGDDDESISYGLREKPKKSWRISDCGNGVSGKAVSCKECGKEFPTVRSLSGHMRCHSIKNNKERHCCNCKECGKGFDSMRAMFGHMKTHSRKSRTLDESGDSLSELEDLCPVRKKRSRIMYKNPSFMSSGDEMAEAEAAAISLMMLSWGVRAWDEFKPTSEFSDDDSVYFGAESPMKGKEIGGTDDSCVSGFVNSLSQKMHLDSKYLVENDEMKLDFDIPGYGLVSIINETRIDLEAFIDGIGMADTDYFKEPKILKECSIKLDHEGNRDDSDFVNSSSCKEGSVSVHESGSEKYYSEDAVDDGHETLKDFLFKSKEQGLEGPKARYKIQENPYFMNTNTCHLSVTKAVSELEQDIVDMGMVSLESAQNKGRKCPVCFKIFRSGQALGGHMRAHYTVIKTEEKTVVNQETDEVHKFLDLNVPTIVDEGANLWWLQTGHENEGLVLTN